jgi:hypothetical protein
MENYKRNLTEDLNMLNRTTDSRCLNEKDIIFGNLNQKLVDDEVDDFHGAVFQAVLLNSETVTYEYLVKERAIEELGLDKDDFPKIKNSVNLAEHFSRVRKVISGHYEEEGEDFIIEKIFFKLDGNEIYTISAGGEVKNVTLGHFNNKCGAFYLQSFESKFQFELAENLYSKYKQSLTYLLEQHKRKYMGIGYDRVLCFGNNRKKCRKR